MIQIYPVLTKAILKVTFALSHQAYVDTMSRTDEKWVDFFKRINLLEVEGGQGPPWPLPASYY